MAQQFYIQIVESDTDTCDSDDSQQDPTFNILENTRSKLSNLSINKKSRPRVRVELDEDADSIEPTAPEFDANEDKRFEIVQKIIEGGQVEKLKVEQCKLYLRRHGLRLTGKKDILIQRINEHISIVNGEGEQKYPASSFVMNCKGDACTGDVVMFEQNVYELFNIASRSASGPPCGQRIVAGRIVKESYGAAKQQHTFTIEVLWSKGTKPLPPLHPLLIKGRNLYRLKTMRQRWEDESERQKILSEKHARGNVARSSREARLHEKEMKKALRENRASKGNIKSEKQQTKRKASPTRPINSQRTSIQSLGSTFMGNCPSRGMDHEYHGAPYKENMNLDNLRSIDGPSRGMHDTQRRAQDEENVKPNALKGIDGPPRGMHYTHRGAQDKEHVKPNALRGIDGPLRKSFHAEQNMRFYPPRHDYVMSHNTLRSTDSLLRRSFHVEQSMRFYPPTHDYDMNHNTLRGIDMGMDHKYQGSLSMGMDHGAPLRKSFQVERNMGFYPPKHDHDPRNVAESYSFQQASYLPRGHYQGKRQQLCRYYAQGGCHHGTNCKYLH